MSHLSCCDIFDLLQYLPSFAVCYYPFLAPTMHYLVLSDSIPGHIYAPYITYD